MPRPQTPDRTNTENSSFEMTSCRWLTTKGYTERPVNSTTRCVATKPRHQHYLLSLHFSSIQSHSFSYMANARLFRSEVLIRFPAEVHTLRSKLSTSLAAPGSVLQQRWQK